MDIDINKLVLNLRDHTRSSCDKTSDRVDAADVIEALLSALVEGKGVKK